MVAKKKREALKQRYKVQVHKNTVHDITVKNWMIKYFHRNLILAPNFAQCMDHQYVGVNTPVTIGDHVQKLNTIICRVNIDPYTITNQVNKDIIL
jgi:hypothetical protein